MNPCGAQRPGELLPPVRLLPLSRPESFAVSLRSRWVQAGELRLHFRVANPADALPPAGTLPACALGFVLSRKQCRHAARRNLIRRIARERVRAHLRRHPRPAEPEAAALPVLVLRLQRRFDAQWRSQQSQPLRRYLQGLLEQLLGQWEQSRRPSEGAHRRAEAP